MNLEKKKKVLNINSMSSCSHPLLAARLYKPLLGKSVIKILPKRVDQGYNEVVSKYGRENLFFLPCGRCSACISRRKKEWSIRCAMEAVDHKENCFVTLTYDEDNYPGVLKKDDLQKFIKSLRNHGITLRYFGCGEHGDGPGQRCHFHILLFGYMPDDLKFYAKSKSGVPGFTSKFLTSIWNKGLVLVQEFSPFAASYVAGYCLKKLFKDDDSFHIQSTRPGIGAAYFFRNVEEIYDTGKLVLNFGSHVFSVPRYFDKLADQLDLDLSDVKEKRLNLAYAMTYKAINETGSNCFEDYYEKQGIIQDREMKYRKRFL